LNLSESKPKSSKKLKIIKKARNMLFFGRRTKKHELLAELKYPDDKYDGKFEVNKNGYDFGA